MVANIHVNYLCSPALVSVRWSFFLAAYLAVFESSAQKSIDDSSPPLLDTNESKAIRHHGDVNGQISRSVDLYEVEKENGHYELALLHLENAYKLSKNLYDSLVLNSSSQVSVNEESDARKKYEGSVGTNRWLLGLMLTGSFLLIGVILFWLYQQVQVSRLRVRIRDYLEDKLDQGVPQVAVEKQSDQMVSEAQSQWLEMISQLAVKHLADPSFSLESWSAAAGISTRQFQRKLKAESDQTVTEFLHEIRMQQAKKLLKMDDFDQVKDLAAAVGMRDVKYFSKVFKARFGELPSKYLKK